MSASPSQAWSSAVHDLFACARGRLPAAFLERKLADLGIAGVKPLPREDLPRFEKAVDLVNALVAGQHAPGGKKPDAAIDEAFPAEHQTFGGMRPIAHAYLAAMRPAKASKAKPGAEPAAPPPRHERGDDRGPRQPRGDDRGPRQPRGDRPSYGEPRERRPAPELPPRPPRVTWEAWLDTVFPPAPAPAAAAPAAATPAPAASADGSAAAPAPAEAPAPVAAPAPAPTPVFTPPALATWNIDPEAKRHLARIRERVAQVIAVKAEPAAALRELAFAILRPPLPVRDDLRVLIAEHLQRNGVMATTSALYPPPPVAALKRDWENFLAARGPADAAVEAAWKKLLDAHPEARAKLEHERAQELDELVRRFAAALREHGEADPRTAEARARLEGRHAAAPERIAAELARFAASAEASANAGRLVAERGWEDPEAVAAIAALDGIDPQARQRLEAQRRHELDELDRRVRTASRESGPAGEATRAALERLRSRFPAEGAAAAARLERLRLGEGLAQQEQERREAGRSLSGVHLGAAEHRLTRLKPAPRWRLAVAMVGGRPQREPKEGREGKDGQQQRPRRHGQAVALLLPGASERGPVAAGWRAADCGSLDEIDACVQAVVDREGGVIGLHLADCAERGNPWSDAAWTIAALVALAVPVEGATEIAVELPEWADGADRVALGESFAAIAAAASGHGRSVTLSLAAAPADHAASLAEAVAWSWSGRREAETARIRQSGLDGGSLLQPSPAVREALLQLATGALPGWTAWSGLLAEAADEAGGPAEALLERLRARLSGMPDAIVALHRHLTGLARGRIADPARLGRELAWLDGVAAGLRPRDRLRLDASTLAAEAAAGRIDQGTAAKLAARLAELREDWPAEVAETAIHAAIHAREACDTAAAEALIAPWARLEAVACGGRALLVRLCEERARIAAADGRWKEARKQLERATEAAGRCADPGDREGMLARLAALRAAILSDDPSVPEEEARAAILAVLGEEPVTAAARLSVAGAPRQAHLAVLRWAVRRQDEVVIDAYLGRRPQWAEPREAAGTILALRATMLAAKDADAARAMLAAAAERLGGEAAPVAQRLSLLACAVAAALHGAAQPELKQQLTALRNERPAAAPAVAALERALALAPDAKAGLAEALPLLAR